MKNLLAALAALPLCACGTITFDDYPPAEPGSLLAERSLSDGTRVAWRLYGGGPRGPRIDRTESTVVNRPRMGLSVSAVDRMRAELVGVPPWRGVWVDEVTPLGPAARAGLEVGDIVLALGGEDVGSPQQFTDLVETLTLPEEPVELTLRARGGERAVVVVPAAREVRRSRTESIALESSRGVKEYTGLEVAALGAELARELLERDAPLVLVSDVAVGSQAYYAGFRAGDRVVDCDGYPVASLEDLRASVLARVRVQGLRGPLHDLTKLGPGAANELLVRGQPGRDYSVPPGGIELTVDGALGRHTEMLEVSDARGESSGFDLPIVLEYHSDPELTRVSFLDFIFQFGFNYRRRTVASASREPNETASLSILPLGMFAFGRGVTQDFEVDDDGNFVAGPVERYRTYRLFWLLSWNKRQGGA